MSKVEEYRTNITLHLTRMSGDIEHIKEKVNDNNKHLLNLNGRVRNNEVAISRIKGIGGTLSAIILAILGWFKIGNFK
tara:strand:+ start:108 stop:341 length:234 start_codon:yes stop_codon:yes gene_type:complete